MQHRHRLTEPLGYICLVKKYAVFSRENLSILFFKVNFVLFSSSASSKRSKSLPTFKLEHRLHYKWTAHGKSPFIITNLNTEQNQSKLIDLVMRIELTLAILLPGFDHLFLHVFIFGNMFPKCHGFVAMPVERPNNFVRWVLGMMHVPIYPYLINGGRRICWSCDWHSNETGTLIKNEFLSKFESSGNKIARVDSITKSPNLLIHFNFGQ